MRIAFVADDLYPGYGGQASASEGHIEVLRSLGHDVWVLAGEEKQPTAPPEGVILTRLPVWRPGDKQSHYAFPSFLATSRLIRWADVVQINTPTPLGLMACWVAHLYGVPAVVGFHAQVESTALHFSRLRPLVSWGLTRWYRYVYRQADCLTAPTEFAARLARGFTPRPVHVVSNGIRLPPITERDRAAAQELRRALAADYLLAYVGRLSPEKRPQDLLGLLVRLPPSVTLAVAGTGPLLTTLQARSEALGLNGRVHFLGYVSEAQKHALLLAADAFVMPSPTELQSIATLEAMARGCAVVAADDDTSAVLGIVTEAGCGIGYNHRRLDEAARDVMALLGNRERLALLQRRAQQAARLHDVRRSGERLADLYAHLLRRQAEAVPQVRPMGRWLK